MTGIPRCDASMVMKVTLSDGTKQEHDTLCGAGYLHYCLLEPKHGSKHKCAHYTW